MVGDSVEFLVKAGLRVFFDAEHFFDGYKRNAEFTLSILEGGSSRGCRMSGSLRYQRRFSSS